MIDKAKWNGLSPQDKDDHLLGALEGVLGQLASIQMQLHELKPLPAHDRELQQTVTQLREELETLRNADDDEVDTNCTQSDSTIT